MKKIFWILPLLLASTIVQAETIELMCRGNSADRFVSIDTIASTVVTGLPAYDRAYAYSGPATITSDLVTWSGSDGTTYSLDRRTSVLIMKLSSVYTFTCTRASPAF
jgi:hypothetical protein